MQRLALTGLLVLVSCATAPDATSRDTSSAVAIAARAFPSLRHPRTTPAAVSLTVGRTLAIVDRTYPTRSVTVRPLDVNLEASSEEGSVTVFADAAPDLDVLEARTGNGLEELRVLRSASAPTRARYALTFGAAIHHVAVEGDVLVARDADGAVVIRTDPVVAIDAHGVRRAGSLALANNELVVDFDATGLAYPIVVDPAWTIAGSLAGQRFNAVAIARADGRVVLAGGWQQIAGGGSDPLSTTEIYDPKIDTWSPGPRMSVGRAYPRMAPLGGGKYLFACGSPNERVAEIYDPTVGTDGAFVAAGTLTGVGNECDVAALPGGGAIAIGGPLSVAVQKFTPPATWSALGTTDTPLGRAVAMTTGEVVAIAGVTRVFTPSTSTWRPVAADPVGWRDSVLIATNDGRALHVGREGAALFNPTTNAWTTVAITPARGDLGAALLPSGQIVVVGGRDYPAFYNDVDFFDPAKNVFTKGPPLAAARRAAAVAPLPGGGVLVAGGGSGTIAERLGKIVGDPCAAANECGSGFCVDGVCCGSACDGQCEACDLPGTVGACYPVSGAPRGGRPACSDGGTNVCAARTCDGALDRKTCAGFVRGSETTCASSSCTEAGFVANGTCDGLGACRVPAAVSCAPYLCDPGGCKTSCASDGDCIKDFECRGGKCETMGAACSEDRTTSTPRNGSAVACAPYLCGTDGRCLQACAASSDCAAGRVCDVATKSCTPPPEAADEGGCHMSPRGSATSLVGVMIAIGLLLRRRGEVSR